MLQILDKALIDETSAKAKESPRLRMKAAIKREATADEQTLSMFARTKGSKNSSCDGGAKPETRSNSSEREQARPKVNYNFHPSLDDKVQRFINCMEPGTKVEIHHHPVDEGCV